VLNVTLDVDCVISSVFAFALTFGWANDPAGLRHHISSKQAGV